MEIFLKVVVPVIIIVLFYVICQIVDKKDSPNKILFVKLRILLGSIAIGFFLSEAYSSATISTATRFIFFSLIGLYGVTNLHNKYLSSKN